MEGSFMSEQHFAQQQDTRLYCISMVSPKQRFSKQTGVSRFAVEALLTKQATFRIVVAVVS